MSRAHLKLIAALLVIGVVAAAAYGMYYAWKNTLQPSFQARKEIIDLEKDPPERKDVGMREFGQAIDKMRAGEIAAAHAQLSNLVSFYTDSAAFEESRRILGEINMDRLLSDMRTPGKLDYEVKSGDSLIKIARDQKSTTDYIIQVNGLQGLTLQKGDRLLVCELDFSVNISLEGKRLRLLRGGELFKEYMIRDSRGIRSADTKVESRSAYIGNRIVRLGREGYPESDKWITCGKGVTIGPFTKEVRDNPDIFGIFLDRGDVEELYTVLRNGTPVLVVRQNFPSR